MNAENDTSLDNAMISHNEQLSETDELPAALIPILLFFMHGDLYGNPRGQVHVLVTGSCEKVPFVVPPTRSLNLKKRQTHMIFWLVHAGIYSSDMISQGKIAKLLLNTCPAPGTDQFQALKESILDKPIPLLRGVRRLRRDPATEGCVIVTPQVFEQMVVFISRLRKIDRSLRQRLEQEEASMREARQEMSIRVKAELSRELFEAWKDRPERFERPKDTPRERQKAKALWREIFKALNAHKSPQESPPTPVPSPRRKTSSKENDLPFDPWSPDSTDSTNGTDKYQHNTAAVLCDKRILAETQVQTARDIATSSMFVSTAITISVPNSVHVVCNQSQENTKRKHDDVEDSEGDNRALKKSRTSCIPQSELEPLELKPAERCYIAPFFAFSEAWPMGLEEIDGARARERKRSLKAKYEVTLSLGRGLQERGLLPGWIPWISTDEYMQSRPRKQLGWKWHSRISKVPAVRERRGGSSLRFEVGVSEVMV